MKSPIIKISLCLVCSISVVVVLFAISREKTHKDNGFYRFLPPHPVIRGKAVDLHYNSYYFAGNDDDVVYLSNTTAPLHLLSVRLPELDTTHIQLTVANGKNLKFRRNTKVQILPPYFYITDGVTPRLLRGTLGEWQAQPFMYDSAFFSTAIPIGPKSFVTRSISSKTKSYVLGKEIAKPPYFKLIPGLLEKQIDGIFA